MAQEKRERNAEILNEQLHQWQNSYQKWSEMFGLEPSEPAKKVAKLMQKEGLHKILELGGGQGRDSLFLAQAGFEIQVLDYSEEGIKAIQEKAKIMGIAHQLKAQCHDVRQPLPFEDAIFEVCYSHMLYCMALTTEELVFLSQEVRRVLKPGGLNIFTVRNTQDTHYGKGIHRGEDMYEVNGFIVHFFGQAKIEKVGQGYDILEVEEFLEGDLPRRLYRVTMRKVFE